MIILYEETKHILISYGILNKIFMKTVAEYLFSSMSIHRIFGKDWRSRKTEYLSIVKELHNLLVTIPKMTTVALIKYHNDT